MSTRAIGSVGEHFVHTEGVTGSNPVSPTITLELSAEVLPFWNERSKQDLCGSSSMVERQLPKLNVAGSSPVSRSILLDRDRGNT